MEGVTKQHKFSQASRFAMEEPWFKAQPKGNLRFHGKNTETQRERASARGKKSISEVLPRRPEISPSEKRQKLAKIVPRPRQSLSFALIIR